MGYTLPRQVKASGVQKTPILRGRNTTYGYWSGTASWCRRDCRS